LPRQIFDFDGYMGMVQYGPLMHFILTEKNGSVLPVPGLGSGNSSREERVLSGRGQCTALSSPETDCQDASRRYLMAIGRNTSLGTFVNVEEGHFQRQR